MAVDLVRFHLNKDNSLLAHMEMSNPPIPQDTVILDEIAFTVKYRMWCWRSEYAKQMFKQHPGFWVVYLIETPNVQPATIPY